MKKSIMWYASYGTLMIGAAIGIYVMADIYLIRSKLPPGVCPVVKNRPLLYAAIALCIVSFVLSFFDPKEKEEKADK